MFDLNAFLCPKVARKYPKTTKERSLSVFAIRREWHNVFDYLPKTIELMNNQTNLVFEDFLEWAERKKISMDWKLHLYVLHWLNIYRKWNHVLKNIHHREFLLASLSRWSSNHMDDRNIAGMVICSLFSEVPLAIGILRKKGYDENHQAKILKFHSISFPEKGVYIAPLRKYSFNGRLQWHQLSI